MENSVPKRRAMMAGVILSCLAVIPFLNGCPTPGSSPGSSGPHTITYNGVVFTSGAAPIDTNKYNPGDPVTVLGPGSLVNGTYQFAGWTTSTSGPGSSYAPSANFVMGSADITLYAVWIPINFTFSSSGTDIAITADNSTGASFVIPGGVTTIGNNAFSTSSTQANLTSVTIPSSVTSIGQYAFSQCTHLTNITFTTPSSVSSIGSWAFYQTVIASVTIPSSVATIGSDAFASCTSLTSLTIANGLTSIADSLFLGANNLTSVNIPSSVTSIGNNSFQNCSALANVTMDLPRFRGHPFMLRTG